VNKKPSTAGASVGLALGALLASASQAAFAESHVYNGYSETIQIFWQATGCFGVKYPCGEYAAVDYVCSHKQADSGDSDTYSFKSGTSERRVRIAVCSDYHGTSSMPKESTSDGGDKKRCAVYPVGSGFNAHCGYSEEEYDRCKADSSACEVVDRRPRDQLRPRATVR
jgi:hypothetical protein